MIQHKIFTLILFNGAFIKLCKYCIFFYVDRSSITIRQYMKLLTLFIFRNVHGRLIPNRTYKNHVDKGLSIFFSSFWNSLSAYETEKFWQQMTEKSNLISQKHLLWPLLEITQLMLVFGKTNARFYGAASEVINEIKSNSVLWYGLDQSGLNRSENHIIYDYCMDNHSFH